MCLFAQRLEKATLPPNPEALRALAAQIQQALAARDAELYSKTLYIEKLKARLAVLKRARCRSGADGPPRRWPLTTTTVETLAAGVVVLP